MAEPVTIHGKKIEVFSKEELAKRGEDFDVSLGWVRVNPGGYIYKGDFEKLYNHYYNFKLLDAQESPRTIKSHIALSLWPEDQLKNTKVVYVARNPKDTCVSFEHFSRINSGIGFKKDMDTFVEYFTKDSLLFGPYWQHLREAWEKRNHENFLLIFYEDMIYDIIGQLKKIDKFIGTKLTDKQLENVANYCSFNTMKERVSETFKDAAMKSKDGGFFRKGKIGSWKEKLTPVQAKKIDQWTNQHLPDIPFKYE